MVIRGIFCAILIFVTFYSNAQVTDTAVVKPDTAVIKTNTYIKRADTAVATPSGPFKDSLRLALEAMPKKALIRSAILPGLGQYYNKGVWWLKVPAIYGGLVAFGIAINDNQAQYNVFLKEAQYRQLNKGPENPRYAQYSDEGIISAKNLYRRNRDLSFLGALGVYAVNIIEAYVDAKFFRFDIDDDLTFNVTPSIQRRQPTGYAASRILPGIKLSLSL